MEICERRWSKNLGFSYDFSCATQKDLSSNKEKTREDEWANELRSLASVDRSGAACMGEAGQELVAVRSDGDNGDNWPLQTACGRRKRSTKGVTETKREEGKKAQSGRPGRGKVLI